MALSLGELTTPTDQGSASKGLHQPDTIEGAWLFLGERSSAPLTKTAYSCCQTGVLLFFQQCVDLLLSDRRPAILSSALRRLTVHLTHRETARQAKGRTSEE